MNANPPIEQDPEFVAIRTVYSALKNLEPDVQARVLDYVAAKLKIAKPKLVTDHRHESLPAMEHEVVTESRDEANDGLDGISSVAIKWLTRNGIQARQLETIFSIGGDEIDLVAEDVPGKTKKDRMRSVFLLKGVAAYLGTGAPRFTHEQIKEACLHYDAFDANNFAFHLKNLSSEISGTKESGYTLTPRGLVACGKMVKEIIKGSKTSTE